MKVIQQLLELFLFRGSVVGWKGFLRGYLHIFWVLLLLSFLTVLLQSACPFVGIPPSVPPWGIAGVGLILHLLWVRRAFHLTPYKRFGPNNFWDLMFIINLPVVGPYLWNQEYGQKFLRQIEFAACERHKASKLEWITSFILLILFAWTILRGG